MIIIFNIQVTDRKSPMRRVSGLSVCLKMSKRRSSTLMADESFSLRFQTSNKKKKEKIINTIKAQIKRLINEWAGYKSIRSTRPCPLRSSSNWLVECWTNQLDFVSSGFSWDISISFVTDWFLVNGGDEMGFIGRVRVNNSRWIKFKMAGAVPQWRSFKDSS